MILNEALLGHSAPEKISLQNFSSRSCVIKARAARKILSYQLFLTFAATALDTCFLCKHPLFLQGFFGSLSVQYPVAMSSTG